MSEYTVLKDCYLPEFEVQLETGNVFADGDAEPDLVANLLVRGVICRVGEEPKKKSKSRPKPTQVDDGVG